MKTTFRVREKLINNNKKQEILSDNIKSSMFEYRFQNWDQRIRPIGGNYTDNPMFRSKIINSSVQRPTSRKK